MTRPGQLIRDAQRYQEPERVATTKSGFHFVPVVTEGATSQLGLPAELHAIQVGAALRPRPRSETWISYPASVYAI
jgi:hypothetical protein